MNILIVGSGAREYSIGLALREDKKVKNIYFAPGNGGTEDIGSNIEIDDFEKLAEFAKQSVDLTIVGPEKPLVDGIVDIFKKHGLKIFGPSKEASRLEGSKAYMKNFISKYSVPTAKYIETTNLDEALEFIKSLNTPIVVKADGLCAGKGVIIAKTKEEAIEAASEMLSGNSFGEAGFRVVIEEFLDGFELSVFAISDGESYKILPPSQDHKRLLEGNEGPNTGGMGAYAPTPLATKELLERIDKEIIAPSIEGMKKEGAPFEGVLFCGIMVVGGNPYLLEFNVRFGDPECEVILPLIKSSILDLFTKCVNKELSDYELELYDRSAIGVVLASKNYPYSSSNPSKIDIEKEIENAHISFGGVSKIDGEKYASGGRVLVSVGVGKNLKEASEAAYMQCENIKFDGAKYRRDIAHEVL